MSGASRFRANPFLVEAARVCFSERQIQRACVAWAALPAALLVLWWPRGPIAASLSPLSGPRTLAVVSVGLLAVLAWLSARLGADDYAPASFLPVREYARLTPGAAGSAVRGKLAFGFLHTAFLAALASPFVLASAGVSGASLQGGLCILLVAGASAFAFRSLGLLMQAILPSRVLVRDLAMLAAGAAGLGLCTAAVPAASPLAVMLALAGAWAPPVVPAFLGREFPYWAVPVITSLLAAAAFAGGAWASLARAAKVRSAPAG